jgi:CO/xanthine dehydrogenase FAD-binding subunit
VSRFLRPISLGEALEFAAQPQDHTVLLAGGTSLVPSFAQAPQRAPERFIDLGGIDDMRNISAANGVLVIGALATLTEIARSTSIREYAACLGQGAGLIASPQVRNRGTIGGNLAAGRWGAELAVPLLALNAKIAVAHRDGSRKIDVDRFFDQNGAPMLKAGEIITSIEIALTLRASTYLRLSRRRAIAPPIISVAIASPHTNGRTDDLRIAIGNVAAYPVLIERVETVRSAISPFSDLQAPSWYRTEVVDVLVRRAVESLR